MITSRHARHAPMPKPTFRRLVPQLAGPHRATAQPRPADRRPSAVSIALSVVLSCGAVVLVLAASPTHGFLSVSNVKSILSSSALVGIVGVGMSMLVLSGNL